MKKYIILFFALLLYLQQFNYVDLSKYQSETIKVEIKGEVKKPGTYTLDYESSINDLIEASGGTNKNADLSIINLNYRLKNKEVVVIPEKNELQKVSLNSASIEELCTLSGIGPATAQKIIDYRKVNGGYQSIEDVMKVKGIKEKLFAKIKDYLCL